MKSLTQDRLKELLHYDPDTGEFIWKVKIKGNVNPGDLAGCCRNKENRQIKIDGIHYSATHLAWLYMYGVKPKRVWAINGNLKDLSIQNLSITKPKTEYPTLTQKELKKYLHYDPDTGIFIWVAKPARKIDVGSVAGVLVSNGYYRIGLFGRSYKAHRLAWLYMEGYMPENYIDHIDRNPSNNRWNNLREVNHTCNTRNSKIPINNKTGIKGVSKQKRRKKWRAQISVNNTPIPLGHYVNKIDAVKARWEAEKKYGYPNCNTTSSAYQYLKKSGKLDVDKKD
jgi:hypothetical protein